MPAQMTPVAGGFAQARSASARAAEDLGQFLARQLR
jgi:hypothetical protein